MTAGALARALPEREFVDWQRYAARRMLPTRRMEVHLAQISALIAQTMGGSKDSKMSDFLFDPQDIGPEEGEDSPEEDLQTAVKFFGFKPRNVETTDG